MYPVLIHFGSLVIPTYGVFAALGVLAALALSHFTAPLANLDPRHGWNALALAFFSAMVASRALLIAINLGNLRAHPRWLLALALVHHPLLTGVGAIVGLLAILLYARWATVDLLPLADVLTAPIALGMALEQIGCLLAGSDFGIAAGSAHWGAIVYTSTLAERWSGTPLGVPLVPVQLYAALGAALAAALSFVVLRRRRTGQSAATGLLLLGIVLFLTECLRDWEGRGVLHFGHLGAVLDAPQIVALLLVTCGLLLLARG